MEEEWDFWGSKKGFFFRYNFSDVHGQHDRNGACGLFIQLNGPSAPPRITRRRHSGSYDPACIIAWWTLPPSPPSFKESDSIDIPLPSPNFQLFPTCCLCLFIFDWHNISLWRSRIFHAMTIVQITGKVKTELHHLPGPILLVNSVLRLQGYSLNWSVEMYFLLPLWLEIFSFYTSSLSGFLCNE